MRPTFLAGNVRPSATAAVNVGVVCLALVTFFAVPVASEPWVSFAESTGAHRLGLPDPLVLRTAEPAPIPENLAKDALQGLVGDGHQGLLLASQVSLYRLSESLQRSGIDDQRVLNALNHIVDAVPDTLQKDAFSHTSFTRSRILMSSVHHQIAMCLHRQASEGGAEPSTDTYARMHPHMERAYDLDNTRATLAYNLGLLRLKLGDFRGAMWPLRRAAQHDSHDAEAADLLTTARWHTRRWYAREDGTLVYVGDTGEKEQHFQAYNRGGTCTVSEAGFMLGGFFNGSGGRVYSGCGNRACIEGSTLCTDAQGNVDLGAKAAGLTPCNEYEHCGPEFGNVSTRIMRGLKELDTAEILVINAADHEKMFPKTKPPGQMWAVIGAEPAWSNAEVRSRFWDNPYTRIDLSMGFSPLWWDLLASYVPHDLEVLRTPPRKEKKGLVTVAISQPTSGNKRIEYVGELIKHIQVASFGKIHRNTVIDDACPENFEICRGIKKKEALASYKFYLAFDNSNSVDYISEKVWDALEVGTVPVYMGAQNIADFLPDPKAIINVRDFATPRDLAAYLLKLDRDDALYQEHLAWKTRPFPAQLVQLSRRTSVRWTACRMCQAYHAERERNGGVFIGKQTEGRLETWPETFLRNKVAHLTFPLATKPDGRDDVGFIEREDLEIFVYQGEDGFAAASRVCEEMVEHWIGVCSEDSLRQVQDAVDAQLNYLRTVRGYDV